MPNEQPTPETVKPSGENERRKPLKRNIVLFSDGTGNSAAKLSKTNVWRMFEALDKSGQSDGKRPLQFAIYDNGVGTSTIRPLMLLGGAFGFGLKRNVLELYEFLCTHYTDDSNIYLVGFSRGAFTMRMLAALIGTKGILKIGFGEDEQGSQKVHPNLVQTYARAAYRDFRYAEFKARYNPLVTAFRAVNTLRAKHWSRFKGWDEFENVSHYKPFKPTEPGEFRENGTCDIRFMGLFDTVSAYGGPIRELTKAWSRLFWPMEPRDWNVGSTVRKVCHAVAIDDPRDTFTPLLISEKAGEQKDQLNDEERIEQVWFAGAHANVGGGYANDGLSRIPLNWMLDSAKAEGLHFNEHFREAYRQSVDCCAPLYDPRRGLGGFYRYRPRSMYALTKLDPKIRMPKLKVHATVFDRMRNIPTYAPISIDRDVELFGESHSLLADKANLKEDAAGPAKLNHRLGRLRGLVPDASEKDEAGTVQTTRLHGNPFIEAAWDKVWWKRLTYFTTFSVGTFILLLPLFNHWDWLETFRTPTPCTGDFFCFMQPVVSQVFKFLPGFLGVLERGFNAYIGLFSILTAIWGLLILVGRVQKRNINSHLTQFWQWVLGREKAPEVPKAGPVQKFRTSGNYTRFFGFVRESFLPTLFTVVLIWLTVWSIAKVIGFLF